jgi:uncharacterized protein (DUF2235 family)
VTRPWTKKRFAICIDGTWQTLTNKSQTNVGVIARSIEHETTGPEGEPLQQIAIYAKGVGAKAAVDPKRAAKSKGDLFGGLFGRGLEDDLLDIYLRLAFNYRAGDEIFIFGYSRGSFMARSLGGMIGKCGIVSRRFVEKAPEAFQLYRDNTIKPDSPEAKNFRIKYGKRVRALDGEGRHQADYRPPVTYLGIFDTVGQRGVPTVLGPFSMLANKRYAFHDQNLGAHVRSARHACAIDEASPLFPPTLWENLDELNASVLPTKDWDPDFAPYQQRWFPGGHGEVGGGGAETSLSLFPLLWIIEGAERAGLSFDRSPTSPLSELFDRLPLDPAVPLQKSGLVEKLFAARRMIQKPRKKDMFSKPEPFSKDEAVRLLHRATAMRAAAEIKPPYRPQPLKLFNTALEEINAERQAALAIFNSLRTE